jgi:hypothetical protein
MNCTAICPVRSYMMYPIGYSGPYAGSRLEVPSGCRTTLESSCQVPMSCSRRDGYTEPRPGDIRDSQAGILLARKKLGFNPGIGFEEGLRRTWDWHCAQH